MTRRSLVLSPILQNRTLAQQLSGAFVLFGGLVAAAFFLTASAYTATWAWWTPEREQNQAAIKVESAAHTAMLDEESGLRGYLLTHEVRFLEPYTRGAAALERADRALASYVGAVADVPEVAQAMIDTRLAIERWTERWAKAAADTRPGAAPPSISEGKMLFDIYRREEATFAERLNARSEILSRREQRMIAGRVAIELLVFAAVLLLAMRQHQALRDSIVTPVAAVLQHIGRVRDGELEATIDPAGPRELRELGEGLNDMVRALATARKSAESRDDALGDHSLRLRQILDASREFSESLNLAYVVGAVRESTVTVGGYARVNVWLMDAEQKRLISADRSAAPEAAEAPLGQGVAGRAAKSGRITFEGPGGQVRFSDSNIGPVSAIAIPLIVGARVVGALEARNAEPTPATTQVVEILEMLATHAATAIESARLHEVIEERSHVDALTRLFNRRRLEEDLEAECKRSTRYVRPLAFVMLDVDHFKQFNDSHGHPQADTALQEVAEVIAGCVRTTDTAYRYGGEEFCILLRETTAEDAMIFAERVRQRIEQRFSSGAAAGITASFGVAGFLAEAPTARSLVEAADAAMYEAKHAGRNRVMLSLNPPFVATPGVARGQKPTA